MTQYLASARCSPIGITPAYVAERLGLFVRINEEIRRCVVFVGIEARGNFVPTGTGFLIGIPDIKNDVTYHALVTAAHVLEQMYEDEFSVRLNRKEGDAACVRINRKDAIHHPNRGNDVAIVPIAIAGDVYDFRLLRCERSFFNDQLKALDGVEQGDEVFAVGLYTSHHGLTRNVPVVRVGNVAAVPEEPVLVLGRAYVDAYLIELRTIAGLSGSPVFLNPPPVKMKDGSIHHLQKPPMQPIGVLVGYHVVESKEDQIQVPQHPEPGMAAAGSEGARSIDERNTGFGVVIPFERVLEVIEGPEMTELCSLSLAEFRARQGFKPASA
jgi:hypothetical protein